MLVFLVLCACFRTLQGAPILPPHASSSITTVDLMTHEVPIDPNCGGALCRTVNSVVQSCLLTIFACVWTSAHPNINGPRDSDWTCLKRKVVTMLCVLTAPELVLNWALSQRSAAKEIARKYNEEFTTAGAGDTKMSLWASVVGRFQRLSKDTTWRGDGQLWSVKHGYFIQMGGFILYENGYPKEVLDFQRLADLLRNKAIDAPTVTERDLQDRSKGDTISKAIVVLQTTWFVLQCFARWGQHLPLSELEVLTLAFAVMNVAIYAVWWDKPQSVGMAICVPLTSRRAESEVDDTTTPDVPPPAAQNLSQAELASLPQADQQHAPGFDNLPLISPQETEPKRNMDTGGMYRWLPRRLRKDREWLGTPLFIIFIGPILLYRMYFSLGSLLGKLAQGKPDTTFEKKGLRVPMFYASYDDSAHRGGIGLVSCVVGMIFGAIHLLAWASEFPLPVQRGFWRIAAVALVVGPAMILLVMAAHVLGMKAIENYLLIPAGASGGLCVISRLAVIIIALQAIRHPPRDVLRDVLWTSYIPHF